MVGGAFALLGIITIFAVQAAAHVATAEAESGNLIGRLFKRDGQGASGGSFVTFGLPRNYVAIGDSVASGDGIGYGWKWTPGSAGDGSWVRTGPQTPVWEPANDPTPAVQACHRSKQAYPYLVAAITGDNLYNPSCSGASVLNGIIRERTFTTGLKGTAQLGSIQPGYAPPNPVYDQFKPDVVSLTVGMDDINFGEILKWCYVGLTCVTTENENIVNQRLASFRTNLRGTLKEIKDRGDAAGKVPAVVLTTYYDPFNPDPNKECSDTYIGLGNGLGAAEITWMRNKMQLMNQHIREAAATYPNAKVADISTAFAGHEFCTADPWVYGISIWYSDYGNPAPFHPTPKGHEAISKIVAPVIQGR